MKNICFILLLAFLFGINITEGHPYDLEKSEKKKIKEVVETYTTNLIKYSKCGNDFEARDEAQENLLALFEEVQVPHSCDLFNIDADENEESPSSFSYFRIIEDTYHNNIDVNFKKPVIQECIENLDSKVFALVMIEKELTYQGESKKITLLIGIDMETYKINRVAIPEEYKNNNGSCSLESSPNRKNHREYNKYITAADKEYNDKRYCNAWLQYKKASVFTENNQYTSSQMKACDDKVVENPHLYNKLADSYYKIGDYKTAKNWYTTLARLFPENPEYITKIKDCDTNLDNQYYVSSKNLGDEYYSKGYYAQAHYEYQKAAIHNSNDTELREKIITSSSQNQQRPSSSNYQQPTNQTNSPKPSTNNPQTNNNAVSKPQRNISNQTFTPVKQRNNNSNISNNAPSQRVNKPQQTNTYTAPRQQKNNTYSQPKTTTTKQSNTISKPANTPRQSVPPTRQPSNQKRK